MTHDPVPGLLASASERLRSGFRSLPDALDLISPSSTSREETDGEAGRSPEHEAMAAVLDVTAQRLSDNYPYFHPLYAGQMLKPPHPVARAAYALAMAINPNNHARDGGRASSEMEIDAVAQIARMFGWGDGHFLGHLTSSGTIANLEALWVAGQIQGTGRRRIVGSEQAHYTHSRISAVLKLEFNPVRADARGRIDLDALEAELRKGDVGTVVVTLGTTALGAVDRLDQILEMRERYGFRIHVDAAYGGYFKLIPEELGEEAQKAYSAIAQADSIVVDPHKHGLQPYGCGCVLFRDPGVGRFYKHDSPYTYFTSKELHLGEISLECSRAGAAAVALWTTQQLLPLEPGGKFSRGLAQGRRAALELNRRLKGDERFETLADGGPELDIVVWKVRADPGTSLGTGLGTDPGDAAQQIFSACADRNLHLALVQLPLHWFRFTQEAEGPATQSVTCLRSVLMKPEHEAWMGHIWELYDEASRSVLGK